MRPLEVYERPHCACCGQLITWSVIVERREGHMLNFCGAQCVHVFDSYSLPTYGAAHILKLDRSAFAAA